MPRKAWFQLVVVFWNSLLGWFLAFHELVHQIGPTTTTTTTSYQLVVPAFMVLKLVFGAWLWVNQPITNLIQLETSNPVPKNHIGSNWIFQQGSSKLVKRATRLHTPSCAIILFCIFILTLAQCTPYVMLITCVNVCVFFLICLLMCLLLW